MRKLLSLIIAAVMLLSCFAVASFAEAGPEAEYTVGDVNRDGKYNLSDTSVILKYIAKWDLGPETEQIGAYSDVNKDGKVNLSDVRFYLEWIASGTIYPAKQIPWYSEYRSYCKELRDSGLPEITFNEWLASERGVDPADYNAWVSYLDGHGDISYEAWFEMFGDKQ